MLANVATEKRVMLFGIKHDQKEANFHNQSLGPVDAILMASDLAVSGSLTSVWTPAHTNSLPPQPMHSACACSITSADCLLCAALVRSST